MTEQMKKPRGFAAMSPEQRRVLSSKGGKTAHRKGVAFEWNREKAVRAGERGRQRRREKFAALEAERELVKDMEEKS